MKKYVVNNEIKSMTNIFINSKNIKKDLVMKQKFLKNISIYEFDYFYNHVINYLDEEDKKMLDVIKHEKQLAVDVFYEIYNQGNIVTYLNSLPIDKIEYLKNILGFCYTEEELKDKSLLLGCPYEELVQNNYLVDYDETDKKLITIINKILNDKYDKKAYELGFTSQEEYKYHDLISHISGLDDVSILNLLQQYACIKYPNYYKESDFMPYKNKQ